VAQSGELRRARTSADLEPLSDQFLEHIVEYRRFSEATARAYRRDIERLLEFLSSIGLSTTASDVTTGDLRLFLNSLRHLAPSSVRRTLYGVSSFFEYLREMEILSQNPAAPIDPPKVKHKLPEVPSRSQCRRLLDACETPSESTVIGLMLLAGLRRSEVLGLDVAAVAADLSSLRIEGKGGHQRDIPISSQLRTILQEYLPTRGATACPALLINAAGNRVAVTTLYRLFRRVLDRANLGDSEVTPHSLRHAFATELVRAGVDVATISELLGHANIATTSIYLHASSETKRAAVERLDFVGGTSVPGSCVESA